MEETKKGLRSSGERHRPALWEIQSTGKEGARASGTIQAEKRRCYEQRLQKDPRKEVVAGSVKSGEPVGAVV